MLSLSYNCNWAGSILYPCYPPPIQPHSKKLELSYKIRFLFPAIKSLNYEAIELFMYANCSSEIQHLKLLPVNECAYNSQAGS